MAATSSDEAFLRFLQRSKEINESKPWHKLDIVLKRQKIQAYIEELIRLSDSIKTKESLASLKDAVLSNYAGITVNYVSGVISSIDNLKMKEDESGEQIYEFHPGDVPDKKKPAAKTTAKNKPKAKKQLKLKTPSARKS
jgi:hypothetical protein